MVTHSSILGWRLHEQRSLVGYGPWGPKESAMTRLTYTPTCPHACLCASPLHTCTPSFASLLLSYAKTHCSLGGRNGRAKRPICLFHIFLQISPTIHIKYQDIRQFPRSYYLCQCALLHRSPGPWGRTKECPVGKLLESQVSAARLRLPWVSAKLTVLLLFSLPFLWINRGFWSLGMSMPVLQQAHTHTHTKSSTKQEGEGRKEVDHSQSKYQTKQTRRYTSCNERKEHWREDDFTG